MWNINLVRIALALLLLVSSSTIVTGEKISGWVSEENCKEQHAKPGGKDCVKKCLRGGAHVGHPEWTPQKMMFVEANNKNVWNILNPEALRGYEGEFVLINAERNAKQNTLKIAEIYPFRKPAASKLFQFQNGFWINLHHFLRACARRELYPEEKPKVELVARLQDDEKKIWNQALEYYETHYAQKDLLFDQEMIVIKNWLVDAGNRTTVSAENFKELRRVLMLAAPVYRKYWWPEHERSNREWIQVAQRLLDQFGERISTRIERAYGVKWPEQPMRVDVSVEAGPFNAYTTVDPVHITISSINAVIQDYGALETLFHESSHAWGFALRQTLDDLSKESKQPLPPDFWHAFLFYTAGEITRTELEQAGIKDYIPYADRNHIYERGWQKARCALQEKWKPFLENKAENAAEAFQQVVQQLNDKNCAD
jgi:hypothetical protein